MARDHDEDKEKAPQVVEREIDLSLINAKLNEQTGLLLEIAEKVGLKSKEE